MLTVPGSIPMTRASSDLFAETLAVRVATSAAVAVLWILVVGALVVVGFTDRVMVVLAVWIFLALIWSTLGSGRPFGEVLEALREEFGGAPASLDDEVAAFLTDLEERNLLAFETSAAAEG